MDKHLNMPLSIECFAAYLDHNLPDSEMHAIENLVSNNESLSKLVTLSKETDTFMAKWQPEETSFDINLIDLELPQLELFNSSDNELTLATLDDMLYFEASVGDEFFDYDSPIQTNQDLDINHEDTLTPNDDSLDFDDGMSSFDDTSLQQ